MVLRDKSKQGHGKVRTMSLPFIYQGTLNKSTTTHSLVPHLLEEASVAMML